MECLKLCMEHPEGIIGFIHLFRAALAELALVMAVLLYLGKAKRLTGSRDMIRLERVATFPVQDSHDA